MNDHPATRPPMASPNNLRPPWTHWSLVIFSLTLPTFVTLAYFVWARSSEASIQQTVYAIAKAFQFLFPIVWVVWVERRRPKLWPISSRGVLLGGAFGLVVLVAALGLYAGLLKSSEMFVAGSDAMQEKLLGLGLDRVWKFAAVGLFYSICHSFLEEYYWRWFVFGQLRRLVALKPAIVVSSLGFMAHHVLVIGTYFGFFSLTTWLFSFAVAIGGGFWAWLYNRSGSLLGPWLGHLLIDAAIFLVGYDIIHEVLVG